MAEKYTIKQGDTLTGIALAKCGDANTWKKIYWDNKAVIGDDPDFILPGQVLHIDCPPTPCIVYEVKLGDNLTLISKKICGNENWKKIYDDNKAAIGNDPNLIFPGQILIIRC
jgi:nucleoid-associated protein YgaU